MASSSNAISNTLTNTSYGNEPISTAEFLKFKDEVLKLISTTETTINAKIDKHKEEMIATEKNYENKIKHIDEHYANFIQVSSTINNRLDRLNTYESFTQKTNDQLVSHEIRLTNISKDFTKAVQKYDKIYLDNLVLPGYIGEFCKFKNAKEFFDDTIKQIGLLNSFKEKNIMDLKKYKERLETIIKNFNLQVDNNTKANMKYTNEIKDKTERNFNEKFTEIKNSIFEMKLENSKYAIELKAKSLDLSKEWDKMRKIKEEIYSKFDERVHDMTKSNDNTVHCFNELKDEFHRIRRKFGELAEFIRDVRFRKNIGGDVKKREIKQLINKISFKRKNSFDNITTDNKPNNNKEIEENIIDKNSPNMRQSQSHDIESKIKKYIKGESTYAETATNNKKKKTPKSGRSININVIKKEDNHYQSDDEIISKYKEYGNNTDSSERNNSEVKNSFNGRYDPLLDTNDKIIHELAAELEQSANKLDRIELPENRVIPTLEGTSHTLFPKKKQANVLTEDDNPKSTKDNQNPSSTLNKTVTSNIRHTIASGQREYNINNNNSNNNSYINVFDIRKGQKELDKKINIYNKKLTELELYTKQKLIELAGHFDQRNPSQTKLVHLLFNKELNEINHNNNNNTNNIQTNSNQYMLNKINLINQIPIMETPLQQQQTIIAPIKGKNSNTSNTIAFGTSVKNINKPNPIHSNRIKTGIQSSNRLNAMIAQTIGSVLQDEYNKGKKVGGRQIIDCDLNTNYNSNINSGTHNNQTKINIQHNNSTNDIKWVPVKAVLTNHINQQQQTDEINYLNN